MPHKELQRNHNGERNTPGTFVGALALCLLFFASAGGTWAYLSDTAAAASSTSQAQTAAVGAAQPLPPVNHFAGIQLAASSATVVDLTSGQTLYALNADTQRPLASLTKVALALAIMSALPDNTLVSTPATYPAPPLGGTQRLPPGQTWTLHDALDFTLTASSDDGANLIAHIADPLVHEKYQQSPESGSTVWLMNQFAHQLGLQHTYFLNDTGLDESTTQSGAYGSASDVAKLFAYAASTSPDVFAATTQPVVTITSQSGTQASAHNTDEVLSSIPGIIMGKTGYTDLAGGNLAVVFQSGGHRFVAVVLGSTFDGRFEDMKKLVQAAQQSVN